MRNKTKILVILLIAIFLIYTSTYIEVFATSPNSNLIEQGEKWIKLVRQEGQKDNDRGDWTSFNDLAGILWGAGVFIVLICGTILGIKYMFSSVEEKANIKENMRPYIIGAVIILGALSIWKFLVEFLDSI